MKFKRKRTIIIIRRHIFNYRTHDYIQGALVGKILP